MANQCSLRASTPEKEQKQAGECHDERGLFQRHEATETSRHQHGDAGERDRNTEHVVRRSPAATATRATWSRRCTPR